VALEQIFTRILEEARQQAENIIDNALKEKSSILQEIEKEAHLLREEIIARGRAEGEFAYRKEVVAKKLQAQKDILKVKKSQLDTCFEEAREALLNLDTPLYRNLISNMLSQIHLKEEAEIIFSCADESRISQDHIHKINSHLKLSFADNIQGGFIVKTKELVIDNSLGSVLASLRQGLELKVAQILFTPLDSKYLTGFKKS
jgi:V/A-type H+-transporting ATPase subunit E